MSLLTGKAKEDFFYWNHHVKDNHHGVTATKYIYKLEFCELNNKLKNSVIIDWLDSVGIYITPQIDYQLNFYCRLLLEKKEETPTVIIGHDFKSRSGAIEDGIKKANKIYNER